ncbi:MAG TPA: IPT/TIG domain-containing protein [Vicinamibacterales bacterium]|nr:IPT/TIG domain-containing protein [Vicinamibacterales bacterium]
MIRSTVFVIALAAAYAGPASAQPMIGGCPVLPADNIWNTPVDTLPVLANSATMVNTIGASRGFHADFGAGMWDGGPIGIPFITVPGTQTKYPASFLYDDESDPGPYAVPLNAPIEGGANATGDRHAIAVDTTNCILYELYRAFPQASSWTADSGALFDLRSNALRPSTWTSADAAGLPIMPGLVTVDEVLSGEIRHAIRFTAPQTRREFVWPARHYASSLTGTQYPRMGERFRLKASFDISPYPADVQVILRAMKKYGIILADNGSAWFISGKPDPRWDDDNLHTLSQLLGSNFEAVDATVLRISPDSGAARQNGAAVTVSPSSASVRVGQMQTFSATVTGATGGVTWSVNDVPGGDGGVGTIDTGGRYLAPASEPNPNVVTVRAASVAVPTATGSAMVTVLPLPSITSVSPSSLPAGPFTLTVNGAGFTSGAVVSFGGMPLPTTVVSPIRLTATGTASSPGSVPVVATMSDGTVSNSVFVTVAAPVVVGITISPSSATVRLRQQRQFTATVTGTTNTSVAWKVNGVTGGNNTVGRVSQTGVYTAPRKVPSPATVNVSATSVADPTKVASAQVTVSR